MLDDQIDHYGAHALENDPSVQSAPTTGGITEFYRIRGFSNATNILNAQYWQTFTGVQPGDPRMVRLSASMRF